MNSKRLIILSLIFPFLSLLASCASTQINAGVESVNADIFKDQDDFKTRSALLAPGMGRDDAFSVLGITTDSPNLFRLRSDIVLQIVQNSGLSVSTQLFEDSLRILNGARYIGWELPFSVLKKKGYFKGLEVVERREGFKLWLVLIFFETSDGVAKLTQADIYGSRNVDEIDTDSIIWRIIEDLPVTIPKAAF